MNNSSSIVVVTLFASETEIDIYPFPMAESFSTVTHRERRRGRFQAISRDARLRPTTTTVTSSNTDPRFFFIASHHVHFERTNHSRLFPSSFSFSLSTSISFFLPICMRTYIRTYMMYVWYIYICIVYVYIYIIFPLSFSFRVRLSFYSSSSKNFETSLSNVVSPVVFTSLKYYAFYAKNVV